MYVETIFGARLLIKPVEEIRDSNIILPVGVDVNSYRIGKVIKIGTLLRSSKSLDLPFLESPSEQHFDPIEGLEEGDLVLFSTKSKGVDVQSEGEKMKVIEFKDLVAKIKG